MNHITTTPFGRRPVSAGLLAGQALARAATQTPARDKWQLFHDLRAARTAFGVSDRDLTVLNALLSFLPERELRDGEPLIVFPSNAALSDRAHGMAESTLRRHLAALVAARLIARHDSPNGKRYAARGAGGQVLRAFGFDLRPLLVQADTIAAAAETARQAEQTLHLHRETAVLLLRDVTKLAEYIACNATLDRAALHRRALRRKLTLQDIDAIATGLRADLAAITAQIDPVPEKMDANAASNERHHTNSNPDNLDSEPCQENGSGAGARDIRIPLALVLKACPDILPYARHEVRDWRGLVALADDIRPMLGISDSAWADAQATLGRETAAVTTAAILQRAGHIRSPGGYLRALTAKAAEGAFSPGPMIMALLSADAQSSASSVSSARMMNSATERYTASLPGLPVPR
ncbi:MAG: replication initiation protein RepC [Pseudooceanicola sp.]|nr:replication initiation protein RepC [Pseudooceanicola sp.]